MRQKKEQEATQAKLVWQPLQVRLVTQRLLFRNPFSLC